MFAGYRTVSKLQIVRRSASNERFTLGQGVHGRPWTFFEDQFRHVRFSPILNTG
jgi:hypothetical protein